MVLYSNNEYWGIFDMQALTFSAQSLVGLYKCTVLYVGMMDVSHLVWVLFSVNIHVYFHGFYTKPLALFSIVLVHKEIMSVLS